MRLTSILLFFLLILSACGNEKPTKEVAQLPTAIPALITNDSIPIAPAGNEPLVKTSPSKSKRPVKKSPGSDPFKNTMPLRQEFDVDPNIDQVLEGKDGTVLVLPKGCFLDARGQRVSTPLKLVLMEALTLTDMLLANLTTTSNGKPLISGGMLHFEAKTLHGEALTVDKNNPVYIEIPAQKRVPGMMAYRGIRDENGNMDWVNPKPLETFLTPVNQDLLDFYPPGFEKTVEEGVPFKQFKVATRGMKDSLFYAFAFSNLHKLHNSLDKENWEFNEPYYNPDKEVKNGQYTEESYQDRSSDIDRIATLGCGIDPAIIKVIRSKEYANTLLATREFEARLRVIYQTCHNSILEIYIQNLEKNLWELDKMAADAIGKLKTEADAPNEVSDTIHSDLVGNTEGCFLSSTQKTDFVRQFMEFARQRLTNVQEAGKYASLLKGFYEKRFTEVNAEIENYHKSFFGLSEKEKEKAVEMATEYRQLLWKREKYRMETYGFEWSDTGWVNVDVGISPKTWGPQRLEILVKNGNSFDRVHTYMVYTSIKSIYRLNSSDNVTFFVGNASEREMLMPKKSKAFAVAIAYRDGESYFDLQTFVTGDRKLRLHPVATSPEKIKEHLASFDDFSAENRIDLDLEYMAYFDKLKKDQEEEQRFLGHLMGRIFPCFSFPLQSQ